MVHTATRRSGHVSFVRYKLGLSQQQLADSLGVSRSMIGMVETGKRTLTAPVALIYRDMCRSAAALNPEGYTRIKRGRKSTRPDFSVVTNYDNSGSLEKNAAFTAWLKQKRETLRYLHTGLQIKRRATGGRFRQLSGEMQVTMLLLKASTGLRDQLPEGKLQDKYELQAAILYARKIKLTQQLRRYGPVSLLKTEYQMGLVEKQLHLTENAVAAFDSGYNGSDNPIDVRLGRSDHFT